MGEPLPESLLAGIRFRGPGRLAIFLRFAAGGSGLQQLATEDAYPVGGLDADLHRVSLHPKDRDRDIRADLDLLIHLSAQHQHGISPFCQSEFPPTCPGRDAVGVPNGEDFRLSGGKSIE